MAKNNKLLIVFLLIIALLFSSYVLAANSIVQSGTCGTCSWEIDDTGLLRIYPTNGESGTLDSNTKNNATFWPWSGQATSVTKVVIEDGVYANGNTSYLFRDLTNCVEMDLSGLDTSNATSMDSMFQYCKSLTELDVSNFDTSKVTDMSGMFHLCSSLTALDLNSFDTSNVTDMNNMFNSCSNLISLDVSSFNTEKVSATYNMFNSCKMLSNLDISKFKLSNVSNMSGMFIVCSSLTELDVTGFDTSGTINMTNMFNGCSSLIELDVSGFDTSNVISMVNMFSGCKGLTKLDLSNFNTSNVTGMGSMFNGCSSLTKLDISNFDTSNVISMNRLFKGCSSLTKLDLNGFDTSSVANMNEMFYGCSGLIELDVSNFNTSNATDMNNMFYNCSKLTQLDVSGFNTNCVTNMCYMFDGCSGLTKLDVSNFDTSNVTNMYGMFYGCKGLTELDVSNFDTSNVTSMYRMFSGCSSLTELDVSNFDTSNVTSMKEMFYKCQKLSKIIFGSDFSFIGTDHYFTETTTEWMKIRNLDGSKTYDNTLYSKNQMIELDSPSLAGVWVKNYQGDDHTTLPDGSVEYVSNDDYWQIVSDTTWKYTFTVFNDTLNYKLFEEYMDGYQSIAMAPYYIEVHNGQTVIENKLTAKQYGKLEITKTVENNPSTEDEFEFTIVLSGIDVSGTKIFNGVVFENGLGKFTLKANETKIFDLPVGTTYAISEKDYIQYTSVISNETGTIEANTTQVVAVVNTYMEIPEPDNNKVNLTLKKTVSENCNSDTEFYISGYFTNLEPNTTYYMSDGNSFTSNEKGIAYCDVVLKHQNELVFYNLPVGTTYQFTEHENDYIGSVNVKDDGTIKQENANTISGVTTSIETDSIGAEEDILVHFHSDTIPLQDLLLYKKVVEEQADGTFIDYSSDESFEFTIYFSNIQEGVEFSSDIGKITGDEYGEATKTFYIKNGEVVQFYDIPKDVHYVIVESATEYIASYDINSVINKQNDEKQQSLSTEKETIEAGEDNIVMFTNIKPLKVLTTICKVDENDNLLSGAVLKLLDSDGNIIDEWETMSEEHLIYLAPGRYLLQEVKAPNGYLLAESLEFEVVANGENTVTMVNEPIPLLAMTGGNGNNISIMIALLFAFVMSLCVYIVRRQIE